MPEADDFLKSFLVAFFIFYDCWMKKIETISLKRTLLLSTDGNGVGCLWMCAHVDGAGARGRQMAAMVNVFLQRAKSK